METPTIPPFQFGPDFEAVNSGRSSQSFMLTPEQPIAFDAAYGAAIRTRSSLTDITSTSYSAPSPRVIAGGVPANAQFQVFNCNIFFLFPSQSVKFTLRSSALLGPFSKSTDRR